MFASTGNCTNSLFISMCMLRCLPTFQARYLFADIHNVKARQHLINMFVVRPYHAARAFCAIRLESSTLTALMMCDWCFCLA